MSRFEVAGVVLGAFPVVTQGLKKFGDLMEVAGHFQHFKLEYRKWERELGMHKLLFRRHLDSLLLPVLMDTSEIDALIQDPNGPKWKERWLAEALRRRLGAAFEIYMDCVQEMQTILKKMELELEVNSGSIQGHIQAQNTTASILARLLNLTDRDSLPFQKFRLRFASRESDRLRLLAELDDYSSKIKNLLESSDTHAHSELRKATRAQAQSKASGEGICQLWRRADGAFRALAEAWGCTCPQHEINLLLEHRLMATLDLQLMILQPGRHLYKMRMSEMVWECYTIPSPLAVRQGLASSSVTAQAQGPSALSQTAMAAAQNVTAGTHTSLEHVFSRSSNDIVLSDLCARVPLVAGSDYGYLVREPCAYSLSSTKHHLSNDIRCLTLREILESGSGPRFTKTQMREAALVLASAFVQLFDSPWLKTITKDDILFLQDTTNTINLGFPTLGTDTAPHLLVSGSGLQSRASIAEIGAVIDQLGIILLELCFGTTLESRPERKSLPPATTDKAVNLKMNASAARLWKSRLMERDYKEAVDWCLEENRSGVEWSQSGSSTTTDAWRLAMLRRVVEPLQKTQRFLSFLSPGHGIIV